MIRKYKFFRGYIGTLSMMEGQTYATAALASWNDEQFVRARQLMGYPQVQNVDAIIENHNIQRERFEHERRIRIQEEAQRRFEMVQHVRGEDTALRLFGTTTVTTVNPTLWTKVKMFGTKIKLNIKSLWLQEPIGVTFIGGLLLLLLLIFCS